MTKRQARPVIAAMLDQLGLRGKGELHPAQLSGGEKQRAAIARGLLRRPDLCFADEPTSALDWGHGQEVIRLFRESALRRQTAVLIVSHDVRLKPWADRLLVLEDGRLTPDPDEQDTSRFLSAHSDKPLDKEGKAQCRSEDPIALAPPCREGRSQ